MDHAVYVSCAHDEARAKARRSTTQHHTHACSGADMRRQLDCEEKRDPDLDEDRIKDENMEFDPNARLEKRHCKLRLAPTRFGPFRPITTISGSGLSRPKWVAYFWVR